MSERNDGGPAFPHLNPNYDGNWDKEPQRAGMTLRDYFAGQALVGLLASPRPPGDERAPYTAGTYVKLSLALADAMLKAREA